MATINVSSGVTSTGLTLSGGDVMNVLAGGTAVNTVVLSGGLEVVSSGGQALGTVIRAGGVESVTANAFDSGAVISSGGRLVADQIGAGAFGTNAFDDTVLSGGIEIANSQGWVQSASLLGGSGVVSAGGFFQLATVANGGVLTVLSGAGTGFAGANLTTIGSGGRMNVAAGATARAATISAGGTETVFGSASFDTVLSGGVEIVSSGGTTVNTAVSAGGSEIVRSGGTATIAPFTGQTVFGLTVNGGTAIVSSGGTISGATVQGGGTITVLSAAIAANTVVRAGGVESVTFQAHDSGAVISSGGKLIATQIGNGGFGANTFLDTVLSGGVEIARSGGWVDSASIAGSGIVSAGGFFQFTTVTNGGLLTVLSGAGTGFAGANITTISSGGHMKVAAGATARATTISSGGTETVFGSATNDTVLSGGTDIVSSGGVTVDTNVSAGGSEIVHAGGTARIATFNGQTIFGLDVNGGAAIVSSGGTISGATVQGGGTITVLSGGRALGTAIGAGGTGIVSSGGFDSGTVISSGGTLTVFFSNTPNAIGDTVLSGGLEIASAGGWYQSTTFAGGSGVVASGGQAQFITVSGGGVLTVLSGASLANIIELDSGSRMTLAAGARATAVTVSAGGRLAVFGSAVVGTVLSGGTAIVGAGGTTDFFAVSAGGSETVLTGGTALVEAGKTDFGLTASGGGIVVSNGGTTRGALVLNGGLEDVLSGGTATVTTIGTSGGLELASGSIVSGVIQFSGGNATLTIDDVPPTNPIAGFVSGGDVVDLQNLIFFGNTSVSFNSSTDQLTVVEGGASATLQLASGNYSGITFHASADAGGGTDVAVCFCRGTMILTDRGEVPVEELQVGDHVVTLSGAVKPVRWIGVGRDLVTRRNALARPVIVRAGALGDGVPSRDLYLTHGHALYLDGVLVPVEHLVNHKSILWDEEARAVEFYHVELDGHDVLVANGAPAESYYDAANRARFHNAREGSETGEAARPCAPVVTRGDIVEELWQRLFERAGGRIAGATTDDPDLHLVVDGVRRDPVSAADGVYAFALAAMPRQDVVLRSRHAVPSLTGQSRSDHRPLGVALRQIILGAPGMTISLGHDAPLVAAGGAYPPEDGHAWTDGDLVLPAALFAGDGTLLVHTRARAMRYPAAADAPAPQAARAGGRQIA